MASGFIAAVFRGLLNSPPPRHPAFLRLRRAAPDQRGRREVQLHPRGADHPWPNLPQHRRAAGCRPGVYREVQSQWLIEKNGFLSPALACQAWYEGSPAVCCLAKLRPDSAKPLGAGPVIGQLARQNAQIAMQPAGQGRIGPRTPFMVPGRDHTGNSGLEEDSAASAAAISASILLSWTSPISPQAILAS